MKKKYSLLELNSKGLLILFCKKVAFIREDSRQPYMYNRDPSTCYVHYYNNMYVVTQHIVRDLQLEFRLFEDAKSVFANFVEFC